MIDGGFDRHYSAPRDVRDVEVRFRIRSKRLAGVRTYRVVDGVAHLLAEKVEDFFYEDPSLRHGSPLDMVLEHLLEVAPSIVRDWAKETDETEDWPDDLRWVRRDTAKAKDPG